MKLLLCGGGSGEQNVLVNKKLNDIIDNGKPILYVPLAMDENEHSYDSCYEWIAEELQYVDKAGIDMVRTFEELSHIDFSNYAAIFIGGGNTYKLLKGIKDNDIFQKIQNYIYGDGIVIGGSAGAVIFGSDIDIVSVMDKNDVNLTDTVGFDNLSGLSIFPHYTNEKMNLIEEENIQRTKGFTDAIINFSKSNGAVIAIPEEDAVYVNSSVVEVIGTKPYYYCKEGKMIEGLINERFNIKTR